MSGGVLAPDLARVTELGAEKKCVRCGEWWPADREFFYADRKRPDGHFSTCRACRADIQRESRRKAKAPAT